MEGAYQYLAKTILPLYFLEEKSKQMNFHLKEGLVRVIKVPLKSFI